MEKKEQEVMDALVLAWNTFLEIEHTHPSHEKDFSDGIHINSCKSIRSINFSDFH